MNAPGRARGGLPRGTTSTHRGRGGSRGSSSTSGRARGRGRGGITASDGGASAAGGGLLQRLRAGTAGTPKKSSDDGAPPTSRVGGNVSKGRSSVQRSGGRPSKTLGAPAHLTKEDSAPSLTAPPTTDIQAFRTHYEEKYSALKPQRDAERRKAIQDGFLADPEKKTSLDNAITPVGTCTSMCPQFERVERIVQNMVDPAEKVNVDGKSLASEERMIKRFRRSAAGYDEQLPSDIRTPAALKKTLDYLLDEVVGKQRLAPVHKFVWDRTRGIRNDFSIQQVTRPEDVKLAVDCYERIARFHILAMHQLSNPENLEEGEHFEPQQEREQLNNTLLSLMYYYEDFGDMVAFANEPEFRSYLVLFELQSLHPDLEDRMQTWPRRLLEHPKVQTAFKLYAAAGNTVFDQGPLRPLTPYAIAQANSGKFWSILASQEVSYIMACVAEMNFNQVRFVALDAVWRSGKSAPQGQQAKNQEWTLAELKDYLLFDDEDQALDFAQDLGLAFRTTDSGEDHLDFTALRDSSLDRFESLLSSQQIFSHTIVEQKRQHRTLVAVINGLSCGQAIRNGQVIESNTDSGDEDQDTHEVDDGQSLFIPEQPVDDDVEPMSTPSVFTPAQTPSLRTDQHGVKHDWHTNFGGGSPVTPTSVFGKSFPKATPVQDVGLFPTSKDQNSQASILSSTPSPSLGSLFQTQQPPASSAVDLTNSNSGPMFGNGWQHTRGKESLSAPAPSASSLGNSATPKLLFSPDPATLQKTAQKLTVKEPAQIPATNSMFGGAVSGLGSGEPTSSTANLLAAPSLFSESFGRPSVSRDLRTPSDNQPPNPSINTTQPKFPAFESQNSPKSPQQPPNLVPTLQNTSDANSVPRPSQSPLFDFNKSVAHPTQKEREILPTSTSVFEPPTQSVAVSVETPKRPQLNKVKFPSLQDSKTPASQTPAQFPQFTAATQIPTVPPTVTSVPETPEIPTRPSFTAADRQHLVHHTARLALVQPQGLLEYFVGYHVSDILRTVVKEYQQGLHDTIITYVKSRYLSRKYGHLWKSIVQHKVLYRRSKNRKRLLAAAMAAEEEKKKRNEHELEEILEANRQTKRLQAELRSSQATGDDTLVEHMKLPQPSREAARVAGKKRKVSATHNMSQPDPARPTLDSVVHKRSRTIDSGTTEPFQNLSATASKLDSPSRMRTVTDSAKSRFAQSFLGQSSTSTGSSRAASSKIDSTKTDYFKLKAMGIDPDTPIHPDTATSLAARQRVRQHERNLIHAQIRARPGSVTPAPSTVPITGLETPVLPSEKDPISPGPDPQTAQTTAFSSAKESAEDEFLTSLREARKAMSQDVDWFRGQTAELEREIEQNEELRRQTFGANTSARHSPQIAPNGLAQTNGFEYFPLDAKEGRSLSRTEQRIRRTGAHGLATRPPGVQPAFLDAYLQSPAVAETAKAESIPDGPSRYTYEKLAKANGAIKSSKQGVYSNSNAHSLAHQVSGHGTARPVSQSRLRGVSENTFAALVKEPDEEEDEGDLAGDHDLDLEGEGDTEDNDGDADVENGDNLRRAPGYGYALSDKVVDYDDDYEEQEDDEDEDEDEDGFSAQFQYPRVSRGSDKRVKAIEAGPGASADDALVLSD